MDALNKATLLVVKVNDKYNAEKSQEDAQLRTTIYPIGNVARVEFKLFENSLPMETVMDIFTKATELSCSAGGVQKTGEVYVIFTNKS